MGFGIPSFITKTVSNNPLFHDGKVDLTPGFNITRSAGGGIPFVSKGNGSTGQPSKPKQAVPRKPQNEDKGGNSPTTTYGGGGGASSEPAYDPADLAYLDQQRSLYDRLYDSTGRALSSGLREIGDSTTGARNEANLQRSRALEDFGIKREDTTRGQQGALDRVDTNSRTLRDSLMRILGMGASGGSAFDVADNAVARDASKNRTGVQEDYAANWRGLDLSERRADEDFRSILDEIAADRRSQEEALRAGVIGQQQDIQQSLAQIAAERARLLGGDQLGAARPYADRFMSLQNQVDDLPGRFRNAVSARDLNVRTPSLRDYVVNRASIGGGSQAAPQQQYSPYAQFLNKQDDENQMF